MHDFLLAYNHWQTYYLKHYLSTTLLFLYMHFLDRLYYIEPAAVERQLFRKDCSASKPFRLLYVDLEHLCILVTPIFLFFVLLLLPPHP